MNSVIFTVLATIAGANAVSLRDIVSNDQMATLPAANSVVEGTHGLKGNELNKKVLSTAALTIKSDMIAAGCYDDESLHFASCFATVCLGTFLHQFNSEIHISNAHLSFDDAVNSTEKVATEKNQSQNRINISGMQKVVYTADDCLNTEDNQTTHKLLDCTTVLENELKISYPESVNTLEFFKSELLEPVSVCVHSSSRDLTRQCAEATIDDAFKAFTYL